MTPRRFGKGPNRVIAGAKLLTAAVTGAKVDFGESKKVDTLGPRDGRRGQAVSTVAPSVRKAVMD